jgi:hypothetical protein
MDSESCHSIFLGKEDVQAYPLSPRCGRLYSPTAASSLGSNQPKTFSRKKHVSWYISYTFLIGGLILDLIGVILLMGHADKTKGLLVLTLIAAILVLVTLVDLCIACPLRLAPNWRREA